MTTEIHAIGCAYWASDGSPDLRCTCGLWTEPWADWKLCERHTYSSNLQSMIDCPDCDTSSWSPTDSPSTLGPPQQTDAVGDGPTIRSSDPQDTDAGQEGRTAPASISDERDAE